MWIYFSGVNPALLGSTDEEVEQLWLPTTLSTHLCSFSLHHF